MPGTRIESFGFPCRSILSANAGEMGVAQIEFPFNPAPRVVRELGAAIEIVATPGLDRSGES
jgi:hypothetical protein